MIPTRKTLHRWCSDLGMFAVDRPHGISPHSTCKWATRYCIKACFNNKFSRMYPVAMAKRDIANEQSWQALTGSDLARVLGRKYKRQTDRIRLMTRGEAFKDSSDLERVIDLADENPDRLIWVPTKAWRNPLMRIAIEALREICPNLRILASTDPDTTPEEQAMLDENGWSSMFFGDDDQLETLTGSARFKCPKTWAKDLGSCGDPTRCNSGGCFDNSQPVHIHLKEH